MHFESENQLEQPADAVLQTMIEQLGNVVPFLPNVASIETLSREQLADGRLHVRRRWQGTSDNIPKAVRPFISKDALSWIDDATWYPSDYKVEWRHESSLSNLYTCAGTNYYTPHPDAPETTCQIRITGDLKVFPENMPGIPKFLGRRLAPQVEKFIVSLIKPTVVDVAVGLEAYLTAKAK